MFGQNLGGSLVSGSTDASRQVCAWIDVTNAAEPGLGSGGRRPYHPLAEPHGMGRPDMIAPAELQSNSAARMMTARFTPIAIDSDTLNSSVWLVLAFYPAMRGSETSS